MFIETEYQQETNPFRGESAPPAFLIERGACRGKILSILLSSDTRQRYYLYLPQNSWRPTTILVAVHGINRKAKEHVRGFIDFAERHGIAVLAPLFPKKRFPEYQRLGVGKRGLRSDIVLQKILEEVADTFAVDTSRPLMFGYSGGGQFVHRYIMAYPKRVRRAVVAASGWYTLPDFGSRFPYGIGGTGTINGRGFDPADFLKVPVCVVVGDKDIRRDPALRKEKRLDTLQGRNRLERGRNWVAAMKRQADLYSVGGTFSFISLPECGHSFLDCMERGMGEIVEQFFLGDFHAAQNVDGNAPAGYVPQPSGTYPQPEP
ncbi:MAG: hypothetical protein ACOX5Z_03190 [Desulfobulbus sp.]|jgi:pimeloyl-ACP methyl ester carboxylesterase